MKLNLSPVLQRLRSPQTLVLLTALSLGVAATFLSHSAQNQERTLLKESLIQAEALTEDLVIGARLKRDVASGSPISVTDTESRDTPSKTITVRPGYRLLSLPADETSSVSGLIRPGHWIDLWASSALPLEATAMQSNNDIRVVQASARPPVPADLVASAIRVVAVGGDTRANSTNTSDENLGATRYSSLTIEVPGDLVAPLLAAQTRGRLIALLRPDVVPTPASKRSTRGPAQALSASSPSSTPQVEIIVHSQGGQS